MLEVGISSPWGIFNDTAAERAEVLRSIADSGIDHLFIADHVSFRGGNGNDGLVHLAALSGIEPRLNLYLGVFLLALRHPMVAARQVATLAEAPRWTSLRPDSDRQCLGSSTARRLATLCRALANAAGPGSRTGNRSVQL